jgi:hypothetical protein
VYLVCHELTLTGSLAVFKISDILFSVRTNPRVTTINKRIRWSRGSVLAFGTQVRGFTPGRNRRIFRAKKSSAPLPS